MADLSTPGERQFWRTKRPISHEEARQSITRLINSHFKNEGERARISIPANPDRDDDLIAHSYVEQQREREAEFVAALQGVIKVADRRTDEFDRARAILSKVDAEEG